jgi:hypothetical protein
VLGVSFIAGYDVQKLLEMEWYPGGTADWKTWATTRWSESWKKFLDMPGSVNDSSYGSIREIYETVHGAGSVKDHTKTKRKRSKKKKKQ